MIPLTPHGPAEDKPPETQTWHRLAMVGDKLRQCPFVVYVIKPTYGMNFKVGANFLPLN